jgi:hypothetical protein
MVVPSGYVGKRDGEFNIRRKEGSKNVALWGGR